MHRNTILRPIPRRAPGQRAPQRRRLVSEESCAAPPFSFQGNWPGYFVSLKESFNVDEKFDPKHLCLRWDDCCTKNWKLMPTILLKAEKDKNNPVHKAKVKCLEKQMAILKTQLIENLKNEYDEKQKAENMIAMMKTYSWLCSELLRVKY